MLYSFSSKILRGIIYIHCLHIFINITQHLGAIFTKVIIDLFTANENFLAIWIVQTLLLDTQHYLLKVHDLHVFQGLFLLWSSQDFEDYLLLHNSKVRIIHLEWTEISNDLEKLTPHLLNTSRYLTWQYVRSLHGVHSPWAQRLSFTSSLLCIGHWPPFYIFVKN